MIVPAPRDADFVEPAYGSGSLSDVVPAVAAALGVTGFATQLQLPPAASYVLLLIDGLGAEVLRRHPREAPYLSSLLGPNLPASPLTASVPSTTATSLASLGTGLPPGAHGMVGYTTRVPGTNRLLNALSWDRRVDPLSWQPRPTAFDRLRSLGTHVTVVNKREFAQSGLTVAALRGAEYVGADRGGERIAATVAAATDGSLTYTYDGDLDWTGHRYGVDSAPWREQLAMIDAGAARLRDSLPSQTRLAIVADHGMVDSPEHDRTDVDAHVELRDGLALLGGEARFRHVYCRPGAAGDVCAAWREFLGERALVLSRGEAITRGWFGSVEEQFAPRIGDIVVACRGTHGVFSSSRFAEETRLVGLHGSLTRDEMLIPLLVD